MISNNEKINHYHHAKLKVVTFPFWCKYILFLKRLRCQTWHLLSFYICHLVWSDSKASGDGEWHEEGGAVPKHLCFICIVWPRGCWDLTSDTVDVGGSLPMRQQRLAATVTSWTLDIRAGSNISLQTILADPENLEIFHLCLEQSKGKKSETKGKNRSEEKRWHNVRSLEGWEKVTKIEGGQEERKRVSMSARSKGRKKRQTLAMKAPEIGSN